MGSTGFFRRNATAGVENSCLALTAPAADAAQGPVTVSPYRGRPVARSLTTLREKLIQTRARVVPASALDRRSQLPYWVCRPSLSCRGQPYMDNDTNLGGPVVVFPVTHSSLVRATCDANPAVRKQAKQT